MLRMAQLVNHQVADELRFEEQQAIVETDRAAARVTAPATPLAPYLQALIDIAGLYG